MTNEDRYLFLSAKRQRTATANQLSRDLAAATGTVSRSLLERGLYVRKIVICIPLTPLAQKSAYITVQTTSELDAASMG